MAEYTVTKVSSADPKEWSFSDKRTGQNVYMETYKVMLKGEDEPVAVNRKQGDRPHVDEVLTGTIETTEFGKKFKKEPKQNGFRPKDTSEIKAEWAIGQAVAEANSMRLKGTEVTIDSIEARAIQFFAMVDRVKGSNPAEPGFEAAKAAAQKIKEKQSFSDGSPVDEVFPVRDDMAKVNLDDIPF